MRLMYLYTRQRMLYASLCFLVCAIGLSFKGQAQGTQNKEYHHWANSDNQWVNGDLNKNNSAYKEGDVVPHVYTPSGLTTNTSYFFVLRYDYKNTQRDAGGFVDLVDPTGTVTPAGYYDATSNISAGTPFYTENVTIDQVTNLSNDNSGNTIIKQVRVDFTYTGTGGEDAAIYFGLRLATKGEVAKYGSSVFPGASLDTRLDPQGDATTGSRTLSIQTGATSSACDPAPSATISVDGPACDGAPVTVTFAGSSGTTPYTFFYNDPNGDPQSITSDNSGVATISVTTVGSFTYTLTGVADASDCSNAASGTVTAIVNANPTVYTLSGNNDFCFGSSSGSVTLSSSQSGIQYKLQIYNASTDTWSDVANSMKSGTGTSLTWVGLAEGKYRVIATNTTTTCSSQSNEVTLTGKACATTFTKGFWGNVGGKDCNSKDAITLMKSILGVNNSKVFGDPSSRKFTLVYSDLVSVTGKICNKSTTYYPIFRMLPGGTTPAVLPSTANITWANVSSWGTSLNSSCSSGSYGSINNNLLAQTIALYFNLGYDSKLGSTVLAGPNLTFKALSCKATAPASTASTSTATIPCSVFKTIAAMPGGASINNIFVLANRVLSGQVTCITASDMNAAVDAINTGFDRGKILISATGSSNCTGTVCSSGVTAITRANVGSPVSEQVSTLSISAYPNPYSSNVKLTIANPKAGQGSLEVFNLLGQKVSTVYKGFIPAGTQTYNLNLSSVHRTSLIYRLSVNGNQVTGKLLHASE